MSGIILERGVAKRKHLTIGYTFIVSNTVEIKMPGLHENIRFKQGIKVFDDGYVMREVYDGHKDIKSQDLYNELKGLSTEERLECVENIKKSLNNIEKFKL